PDLTWGHKRWHLIRLHVERWVQSGNRVAEEECARRGRSRSDLVEPCSFDLRSYPICRLVGSWRRNLLQMQQLRRSTGRVRYPICPDRTRPETGQRGVEKMTNSGEVH